MTISDSRINIIGQNGNDGEHYPVMRLTNHFTLSELTRSETAARHGIDMTPPTEVIANLLTLCEQILEPLRAQVGPILVTSGYRPLAVNRLLLSPDTSAHVTGCAADIVSHTHDARRLAAIIKEMGLPFDQLIHEFGEWVHVSVSVHPRGQILTAVKGLKPIIGKPKTHYLPGLLTMSEALLRVA